MATMTLDSEAQRKKEIREKTAKPLLWVGMVSIVMFFGGLTSAVVVEHGGGGWVGFQFPAPFWFSTIAILLSSGSFILANRAAKLDKLNNVKMWLGVTLILGIIFMVSQLMGWKSLTQQGLYFTGTGNSASSSYFYVLTWAHFAHAIGGIISLLVVFSKSLRQLYNSKNLLGLQVSATYWHFLGALWVYLFIFLNYINQNF